MTPRLLEVNTRDLGAAVPGLSSYSPPARAGVKTAGSKRILVIDDEPTVRQVLRDVLASQGFLVTEAADGYQGLDCLRVGRPDMVILDLMMPVMNGWKFVEECRRIDRCGDVPIIAISAMFDVPGASPALHGLGVHACLSKPFDIDVLLSLVARLT